MKGLCCLLLLLVSCCVQAAPSSFRDFLSAAQKSWLDSHPTIRIGAMDGWPPISFVDYRGRARGIDADLVMALNKRLDGRLEIVPGPWSEIYDETKQGKLDALLDITPKPEREAFFNFTEPYLRIPHVIVARKDTPYLKDLKALSGKTVALEANIGTVKYLRQHYPSIHIREYRDTSHCLDAVDRGEADAYVGNRAVVDYLITQELLTNLKVHGRDNTRQGSVLAVGTPKKNPILRDILQKALADIGLTEFNGILANWTQVQVGGVELTAAERNWINQHPDVRVGGEQDWPPFDFVGGDGRYQGISKDVMDLVARKTGLKLHYVTGMPWTEMLQAFDDGQLDILPALYRSHARDAVISFSAPYFKVQDYVFMRKDATPPKSLDDLAKLRIAVIDGYQVVERLSQRFPGIHLVKVKSLQKGLDAVLLGKADAYIDGYAVVTYQLAHSMQTGLKPVMPVGFYDNSLRVGVRKERTLLASIVSKGVAAISDEEKNAIYLKWFGEQLNRSQRSSVHLSDKEKAYRARHPVILVNNESNWPPFSFTEEGHPKGLGVALMNLVAAKVGMQVDYVSGHTWSDYLKMAKKGSIDVLLNVTPSPARKKILNFTPPYINALRGIVMRDDAKPIGSLDELLHKTIALPRDFYYTEYFRSHYPQARLYLVDNALEALQAVAYGKADVTLGVMAAYQYLMEKNYITNLKIRALPDEALFKPTPLALAARKSAPELISILNKGLDAISPGEMRVLIRTWLGDSNRYPDPTDLAALNLTPEERSWLRGHRVIRYSEVNWKPLSIIDQKRMDGIMGDYLALLSRRTGIQFQFVPSKSWPDVLDKFKKGEIDLVPGIGDSQEERSLGLVSDRYAHYPMVIVTGKDFSYVRSLDEIKTRTFAVPDHYTSYNFLKRSLPDAHIIVTRDIPEALHLVATGKADVFVGHLAPALYYLGQMQGSDLRISGNAGFTFNHRYLVSPKYPQLLSIINKVVAQITEKEREKFYNDWVKVQVKQGFDYSLFWKGLAAAVALVLWMVFWNRRLKTRVLRATADLRELSDSLEQKVVARTQELRASRAYLAEVLDSQPNIVITSDGKRLLTVNKPFLDFFGVDALAQFPHECISASFEQQVGKDYLAPWIEQQSWLEYVSAYPDSDHLACIAGYLFNVRATAVDYDGDTFYIAVFSDVTQVQEFNRKLSDSIAYGSLIQSALLPEPEAMRAFFDEHFAIWQPKDVVGGDIYLFEPLRNEQEAVLMVVDCTGHGVPGAFMTMLVKAVERNLIGECVTSGQELHPAELLQRFNRTLRTLLRQDRPDAASNAGFDAGVLYVDRQRRLIRYAGAEIPLFYFDAAGELQVVRGDRQGIGYRSSDPDFAFTEYEMQMDNVASLLLSTDGYYDQNGGDKGFPFGKRRLKELLIDNRDQDTARLRQVLLDTLAQWQQQEERSDDVTVVGIRFKHAPATTSATPS